MPFDTNPGTGPDVQDELMLNGAKLAGQVLAAGTYLVPVPTAGRSRVAVEFGISAHTGAVPTVSLFKTLNDAATEEMNEAGVSEAVAFAPADGAVQRGRITDLTGERRAVLKIVVAGGATATIGVGQFMATSTASGSTGGGGGGGGGDASAANQAQEIALETSIRNSLQGVVSTAGKIVGISDNFNRPANATPYSVGDAVNNGTVVGNVVALHFAALTPANGRAEIQKVKLEINAAIAGGLPIHRLHFFNIAAMTKTADNAAFIRKAADNGNYLGYVDIPAGALEPGAGVDTITCVDSNQNFIVKGDANGDVWALLETNGAYTPGNAMNVKVGLDAKQLN